MVLKCRQEQSLVVDILGLVATYLSRCNSIILLANYNLPVYQFRVENWDPVSVFVVFMINESCLYGIELEFGEIWLT
jgi:hypothetical protein